MHVCLYQPSPGDKPGWHAGKEASVARAVAKDAEASRKGFQQAVSYICHEIRNPLHGLLGALENLADGDGARCLVRRRAAPAAAPRVARVCDRVGARGIRGTSTQLG